MTTKNADETDGVLRAKGPRGGGTGDEGTRGSDVVSETCDYCTKVIEYDEDDVGTDG